MLLKQMHKMLLAAANMYFIENPILRMVQLIQDTLDHLIGFLEDAGGFLMMLDADRGDSYQRVRRTSKLQ